ncbi:MAG TPA: MliC family protein [Caulobacteraceae bacterium]|nr:MliC family protein [Caulobacteraceae bacterium]
MRNRLYISATIAAMLASSAFAETAMQPPMNSLDYAYYDCDNGAFEIDYDSDTPTQATILASNKARYDLARTTSTTGVMFQKGKVSFWTDGQTVRVTGLEPPLQNCHRKKV